MDRHLEQKLNTKEHRDQMTLDDIKNDLYDVLIITDEVMTGAGRTGKFLAGEHWDFSPDIIAMAKGFAAGYAPLGVVAAKDEIVEVVNDSGAFLHGHT